AAGGRSVGAAVLYTATPAPPLSAAACSCRPSANSSIILRLNAGRSFGLRLETSPRSTTTSSSTHSAPALRRSVAIDGYDVIFLPATTPASISVHGPWQMTATGLPALKNDRTNSSARSFIRSLSGFITPPGNTRASYAFGSACSSGTSTAISSPHSVKFQPLTAPLAGETTSVSAPASCSALRGSVSSTCSKPFSTSIATRLPCSGLSMGIPPCSVMNEHGQQDPCQKRRGGVRHRERLTPPGFLRLYRFSRCSTRSSTTDGSARVDVSPRSW